MKCPKCGLNPDENHSPEYYSSCSRCSAIMQRRRLRPDEDWRLAEGSTPLKGDCFCQDCGRLLVAPSLLCLACDLRRQAPRS